VLRVLLFISIYYRDMLGLLHVLSVDNVGEVNHDIIATKIKVG
jgi:hypothetical protein